MKFEDPTYQEKALYGQLALMLFLFAAYVAYLLNVAAVTRHIHIFFILFMLLQAACAYAREYSSGDPLIDERDRQFTNLGIRWGYAILFLGALGLVITFWQFLPDASAHTVIVALSGVLIISFLATLARQLVAYRRAA